jgi:hypothetical protein
MSGADGGAGAGAVALSSADGNGLDAKYANLKGESSETQLYALPSKLGKQEVTTHEAELCDVMGRAFPRLLAHAGAGDARDSNALLEEVAEKAGFRVTGVVGVLSRVQRDMYLQFAESYQIRQARTAFHGTSYKNAKLIQQNGFSVAAGERCKYGKGIYFSTAFLQAALFAEPHSVSYQEVLVVQVLQGPSAVGRQGQVC